MNKRDLLSQDRSLLEYLLTDKNIIKDYSKETNTKLQAALAYLTKFSASDEQKLHLINPRISCDDGKIFSVHEFIRILRDEQERSKHDVTREQNSIEGSIKLILLHEIGESLKIRQILSLINFDKPTSFSRIFPTDVYGDFLVSVFSPIPADLQTKLFENIKNFIQAGITAKIELMLPPNERAYVRKQASIFLGYVKREEREIVEGLENLIKKCNGMTAEERRKAYLKFYDEDLESVLTNLPKAKLYKNDIDAVKSLFFEKIRSF